MKRLTADELSRARRLLARFRSTGKATRAEVKELALLARLWLDEERRRMGVAEQLSRTLDNVKRKPGHLLLQRSVCMKGAKRDIGLGPGVIAADVVSVRNSGAAAGYLLMAEGELLSKLIDVEYTEIGEARRAARARKRS